MKSDNNIKSSCNGTKSCEDAEECPMGCILSGVGDNWQLMGDCRAPSEPDCWLKLKQKKIKAQKKK